MLKGAAISAFANFHFGRSRSFQSFPARYVWGLNPFEVLSKYYCPSSSSCLSVDREPQRWAEGRRTCKGRITIQYYTYGYWLVYVVYRHSSVLNIIVYDELGCTNEVPQVVNSIECILVYYVGWCTWLKCTFVSVMSKSMHYECTLMVDEQLCSLRVPYFAVLAKCTLRRIRNMLYGLILLHFLLRAKCTLLPMWKGVCAANGPYCGISE